LIELATLDCTSGRIQSREQAESKNLDEVLTTLSKLTAATRVRLAGTAGNAEMETAPLVTSSVKAYKAYLTGYQLMHSQPLQALAMLEKATQFDSGFADAWYFRSLAHRGLGERQLENEDLARAFALRNRATEMQRQRIEAMYYLEVTGEVYKAIDALRAWESSEPNQFPPHNLLGLPYAELGLYQKAADEYKLTLALAPELSLPYLNLGRALLAAGQYEQAQAVLRRAVDKKFDGFSLHYDLYEMALLRSDAAGLEREREWMANNAEDPVVVEAQASIDVLAGNIRRARQRSQHAVGMALESKLKEFAAEALLSEATAEALVGETRQSRHTVAAALQLADSKQKKVDAAKALALDGQGSVARQMIDRLARENPSDTFLNAVDAPLVLAASQLWNGKAELALRTLEPVKSYEFGTHAGLLPTYLRATAYLQLRRADEATSEFQAVLDHRGVAPMEITWELSQLGLARAYVMQGDTANAHAAYDVFFGLWKDADSDIPILKQAKAEYAKLE
jgi:tetratricopeptide (TPR) repeat protein